MPAIAPGPKTIVSAGIGFGDYGDNHDRFALIETKRTNLPPPCISSCLFAFLCKCAPNPAHSLRKDSFCTNLGEIHK